MMPTARGPKPPKNPTVVLVVPSEASVGEPVLIDGSGSYGAPGAPLTDWQYVFGDGEILTGIGSPTAVLHTYTTEDIFAVTLAVTDRRGERATGSASVKTTAAPIVALASITANPANVSGGSDVTLTVILTAPAPFGGAIVTLQSSLAAVPVPASVTVSAGETTAAFAVTTSTVASNVSGTIYATYQNTTKSVAVTVLAPALQIPAAPTNLTVSATTAPLVSLDWVDNATNESAMLLERCAGAACTNFTQIASLSPNVTTYSDTNVVANTTYQYRVRASNAAGFSGYSNVGSVTVPAPPVQVPAAPSNLAASTTTAPAVLLSWTDNSNNETAFLLERCSGTGCTNFAQITSVAPNTTSYADTSVSFNTTYRYRVRASNSAGASAYSNVSDVTTPAQPSPGASPIDQQLHPRLLFLAADVPTIRTKLQTYFGASSPRPELQGMFQSAINECDSLFGGVNDLFNALSVGPMYALLANVLPCPGFTSTHTPAQHGAEAARLLMVATANGTTQLDEPGWPYPFYGYLYDWAFSFLTPTQRTQVVTVMKTMTTNKSLPIYPSEWSADSSKALLCELVYASAYANDGIDNQWATDVFTRFQTRVISPTGVIGEESYAARTGATPFGTGIQNGLAYMNYQWMYWVTGSEAHRVATGATKTAYYTSDYDALPAALHWLVQILAPYAVNNSNYPGSFAWRLMRSQYTAIDQADVSSPAELFPGAFAGVHKDTYPSAAQLAQWYFRKRLGTTFTPASGFRLGRWALYFLLFDPTVPEASPTSLNLPLSASFGDGRYDYKSGWDPDGTTNTNWAVQFYANRYETLNDGREPPMFVGHYEVHRKGPQTIARGSAAHIPIVHGSLNRLYFRDTTFTPPYQSSGPNSLLQRMAGKSWSAMNPYASNRGNDMTPGSQADYLTEIRSRFANGSVDCDYLSADLTKWWPSAAKFSNALNPAMVTLYLDQKVLFRPASVNDPVLVVIYVRYGTTGTQFVPIYCWNPAAPAISVDGTETSNSPTRFGTGFGNWSYSGASRAIAVNQYSGTGSPAFNGKNVLTVIRPTGRVLIKSGGPDEHGVHFQHTDPPAPPPAWDEISHTWSCEAIDYYGQRYPHLISAGNVDQIPFHGEYFVQVEPTPVTTSGDFLLVNEVGDSGMTPAPCDAITGTNFAGVVIRGTTPRAAIFGTSGDVSGGSFILPVAGTYKVLVANLLGASRTITGGSSITSITDVAGGGGSPFAVHSTKTVYLTIVVSSAGTGAANTVTVS